MFDIYLYDFPVGTLSPRGRGVRFEYSPQALENDGLPALSLSLPKRPEPFPDSRAGPFFRNLLPEQAYKRLVAAAVGTSAENSLALLGAIGGECPGAVSIWPSGSQPPDRPEYQALQEDELLALFSPSDRQAFASAITRGRLSLAGVQEKIALLRDDSRQWHLPLNGAVTSHILKQATSAFPQLLENELFCTALARAVALTVSETDVAGPGLRVFCAERFDRPRAPGSKPVPRDKLHQEDFCQILRTEPEGKYQAEGGPSLRKCAEVILQNSSLPAADLQRLVRWVGFNYLIGNEDAHAKNLALLYSPEGLQLAPHYDLVSTEIYTNLERNLAMKIGRAWDIRDVKRSDWQRFAAAVDVPWDRVRAILMNLADALTGISPEVGETCAESYGPSATYEGIASVVERRSQQLQRELSRG
jgi:serine/threonine-protein kinase HipA